MRKFRTQLIVICFLFSTSVLAQERYTVSGYVREAGSRELLIGVNVYLPKTTTGTTTNTYGFYSLTLPAADSVELAFSFVGYERISQKIKLNRNQELNAILSPIGRQLDEVVISEKRENQRVSQQIQMSKVDVPIQQIKKIPAFLGEKDVLRVLQLMPGVQKGSEGQTGIYVRGGGPDQNLIILDDATVYNASHLFGFFSVFNGDALKSVELTKGGFPARFGGRLSSVVELNMKEGNKEKLHGEGGIGIIASRLTLEGPIKRKDEKVGKTSFLVSGRRTYLDLFARPIIESATKGASSAGYYFYDFNAKINHEFSRKNKLYLSGYFGQDRFSASEKGDGYAFDAKLDWGNATGTVRWNHLFSEKLFGNASFVYSDYRLGIGGKESSDVTGLQALFALKYSSGIRDLSFKYDIDFFPNPKHAIKFGVISTAHRFTPSAVVLENSDIDLFKSEIEAITGQESGVYVEDSWKPTNWLKFNGGFRASHFKSETQNYFRPEPRLSMALVLRPDLSFKASYARMNQYVHLLSNSGIGLPTDLWVPTTDKIKPQQSSQVAAGFAKDFDKKGLSLTIEGYYKEMNNIISYKEGSSFLFIQNPTSSVKARWDDNITAGKGWSYGGEFLLQKKTGRFSGWAGYTLSWTYWKFPELNFGETFFPRYDRRHDISLVGIYELNPRLTISGTWVYGTGNAITLPQSQFVAYTNNINPSLSNNQKGALFFNSIGASRNIGDFGPKNSFRAEAYHRMDLSVQHHKRMKYHERIWEFSVYNAYDRRNPFFYTQIRRNNVPVNPTSQTTALRRVSVFPILPSVSYNFTF